jgi:hypothetical protein
MRATLRILVGSSLLISCAFAGEPEALAIDQNLQAIHLPFSTVMDPIFDADNNIISKTVYHGKPDMAGRPTNIYTQSVDNFPVPLGMDKRPYDYEILTGFQLTPDELAYNRVPKTLPGPRAARR